MCTGWRTTAGGRAGPPRHGRASGAPGTSEYTTPICSLDSGSRSQSKPRPRRGSRTRSEALAKWWKQIELWRGRNCLAYRNSDKTIKPQYALQRLEALYGRPRDPRTGPARPERDHRHAAQLQAGGRPAASVPESSPANAP